ncbi:MAG: hypothetical protein JRF64_08535 [Deltaproteobacteria bacterium]|nr:hypothetical protein [Deltaproteobacteria bacterium]
MNRMPSPLNQTTVLGRVKAALATRGGCAGLDTACAPWFLKLWAMDKRGLPTNGVGSRPTLKPRTRTKQPIVPSMWPGHEEPVWRILGNYYETHDDMVTLDDRSRQLRDEDISGVNQHAYIRLIYRRYSLLVP